ncbi:glycosyltransferase [Phytopseudomonas punonensis]|uniref:Glycosyltransferase involved in cell wall bisynthesis n=1 Tax=Phytopseudomonas punonensis TaxID=1220495 RepID=A0A1M7M4L9_9GAMM|nr:glycosyltransferase [Pseudomonas punonensis]SHM85154.1 Glycosyltransferase involved in cell wall bisynthesis [Pseudomonas punonensis]
MKNNIQILTCVHDSSPTGGGVAGVSLQIHQGLIREGCDAYLLSGINSAVLLPSQFDVKTTGSGVERFPLDKEKKGVLHVHGLWTPFTWRAYRFAKKNGLTFVVSPHGMLEPWAMNHKPWKKRLAWLVYQKHILNSADMLVVNSEKELLTVRAMGVKPPVAVIENGVDKADFFISTPSVLSNKVALFLSRLSPVKGLPDLINAWSLLPAEHGYKLRLYGHADPGYEAELMRLIHKFNVEDSVTLLGPVFGVDKWKAYQGASFFILPSYSENFGIVIAEALWAGLPVITTKATPWECLEREGLGWQVDNNAQQLCDALWSAMQLGDEELNIIGQRASAYAQKNFDWPNIVEKYLLAYRWLINGELRKPEWIDRRQK